MLPLPEGASTLTEYADWLEMNVLVSRGGHAGLDDLREALRIGDLVGAPSPDPRNSSNSLEQTAANVREELDSRAQRTGRSYPFRLNGSSLEMGAHTRSRLASTYAFCLLLSAVPRDRVRLEGFTPERYFEELSAAAARSYLGGDSIRFGAPRVASEIPAGFGDAVAKLSQVIGEGDGHRDDLGTGAEQDDGVDVVAWKSLDHRVGKAILFGACASGSDWEEKLTELQPLRFCQTHFANPVTPPPIKAFFTPRVVPAQRWSRSTSKAGIVFDRCRVAALAPILPSVNHHGDPRGWVRNALSWAKRETR